VSSNEIVDRISQAGEKGVRKTELKKEFQNSPFEDEIGSLIGSGDIVMDKKGTAYYLWRPDDYMKYLLTTDTKFRRRTGSRTAGISKTQTAQRASITMIQIHLRVGIIP
jgi:hypothetical protein